MIDIDCVSYRDNYDREYVDYRDPKLAQDDP
nr:MAG TPA: Light regulated protein Lir1 [Caudoviricetes sp.]